MKNLILSFLITITIIVILGGGGYIIYKNVHLKNVNKIQKEEIERLKHDNANLTKARNRVKEQLASLSKDNRRLAKDARYNRNRRTTTTQRKKNTNRYSKSNTHKQSRTNTRDRTYNPSKSKIYQRFSNNIKLKSDSKIYRSSNNKLTSNAQIYGRFYPKNYSIVNPAKNQISNIKCNKSKNIYNVVDECSMTISDSFDKVYLSRSNVNSIQNFSNRTHMIECKYSRTHGVMHDCSVKMKS